MKKLFALLLTIAMLLSLLTGCGASQNETPSKSTDSAAEKADSAAVEQTEEAEKPEETYPVSIMAGVYYMPEGSLEEPVVYSEANFLEVFEDGTLRCCGTSYGEIVPVVTATAHINPLREIAPCVYETNLTDWEGEGSGGMPMRSFAAIMSTETLTVYLPGAKIPDSVALQACADGKEVVTDGCVAEDCMVISVYDGALCWVSAPEAAAASASLPAVTGKYTLVAAPADEALDLGEKLTLYYETMLDGDTGEVMGFNLIAIFRDSYYAGEQLNLTLYLNPNTRVQSNQAVYDCLSMSRMGMSTLEKEEALALCLDQRFTDFSFRVYLPGAVIPTGEFAEETPYAALAEAALPEGFITDGVLGEGYLLFVNEAAAAVWWGSYEDYAVTVAVTAAPVEGE